MIRTAIISIFEYIWPVVIFVVGCYIAIRIRYYVKNKKKVVLYKEIINIGAIIYMISLFYIVTVEDVSWSGYNLIPFEEISRYQIGSRLFYKNVISNILLFVPLGFLYGYYFKKRSFIILTIIAILISFSIESLQYSIGRVFDVDDILLNTIGGLLGFSAYRIIDALQLKIPKIFKDKRFLNIIAVLVLGLIVLYLLNLFNIGDLLVWSLK